MEVWGLYSEWLDACMSCAKTFNNEKKVSKQLQYSNKSTLFTNLLFKWNDLSGVLEVFPSTKKAYDFALNANRMCGLPSIMRVVVTHHVCIPLVHSFNSLEHWNIETSKMSWDWNVWQFWHNYICKVLSIVPFIMYIYRNHLLI